MSTAVANANYGFTEVEGIDHETRNLTYLAAITDALREEMLRDPNVLVMGEDVQGPFGGVFKVTKGLSEEFGVERVLNTPMAELAFVCAVTGMALMGLRPVIEMQFADFITSVFDSIVQYAGTNYYRWKGAVPWVIRERWRAALDGHFIARTPKRGLCIHQG